MKLREALLSDIPVIHDIRFSVQENVLVDPSSVTPEMCAEYITEIGKGWVCEVDGDVVGFSIACIRDTSIWALFVRPGFEGRQIGQRLLKLAVEWLFEMGSPAIVLSTDPGTRADRFYASQGWTRGEIKPNGEVSFRLERTENL